MSTERSARGEGEGMPANGNEVPPQPAYSVEVMERMRRCGWDNAVRHAGRFTVYDDGDPHGLVYLVCPDGNTLGSGACEGDLDMQRMQFIADACNAALDANRRTDGQ